MIPPSSWPSAAHTGLIDGQMAAVSKRRAIQNLADVGNDIGIRGS
jgi:hypothetical protein